MVIHFNIAGVIMISLALVHVIFPRYFRWKEEFSGISLINRQMMYVHTLFIAIVVLMMGLLCLFRADELIVTPLGRFICLGLGIFWGIRLFVQFFGYSSRLWKGKRFETVVHIFFALTWSYFTWLFFKVALS